MDDVQYEEIFKLLVLQKEALSELALELVTPTPSMNRRKAQVSAQKAIIFRAKIEQRVRKWSAQSGA